MTPVEIVRTYYATWDASLLADDIEWNVLPLWTAGGRYIGPSGVSEFFARMLPHYAEFKAHVDQVWLVTEGNVVITRGNYRGRVKPESEEFAVPFVHIWTLRDGKVARFEQVADSAAMQRILGNNAG